MVEDTTGQAARRWRWNWAWTPFLVIGIALIPNMIMVTLAKSRNIDLVLDDPYNHAAAYEQRRQARLHFSSLGLELDCRSDAENVLRCSLQGLDEEAMVEGARLSLYRPDDRDLDAALAWTDLRQTLAIPLPRRGVWYVDLVATIDGREVRHRLRIDA